jgi:hypothetical protein
MTIYYYFVTPEALMIILTAIRNSALAIAIGVLLLSEFLHPAFHNHDSHSSQGTRYFTASSQFVNQVDAEVGHIKDACPICSYVFLKYYANDSTLIVLSGFPDVTQSMPMDFIYFETHLACFPRGPPFYS